MASTVVATPVTQTHINNLSVQVAIKFDLTLVHRDMIWETMGGPAKKILAVLTSIMTLLKYQRLQRIWQKMASFLNVQVFMGLLRTLKTTNFVGIGLSHDKRNTSQIFDLIIHLR